MRVRTSINPDRHRSPVRRRLGAPERGQAIVEFALLFPVFMALLFGMIEFAFLFNAELSLNYATRDAALIAAEAGNNANADCLILQQVDADLNSPTAEANVITVHIFSATEGGQQLASPKEQTYTRGGATTCGSITVPYSIGTTNYPYGIRCSDLDRTTCSAGFTGPSNTGVDIIGVRIDYTYHFLTPMGTTTTMSVSNAMRMEPIL
jgi:Flp pilus assembly protein TadG